MLILGGCETENNESNEMGKIVIQTYDAPFIGDVNHIYLQILEVSVHLSSDTAETWLVLSERDTIIDFLELVNGQMATLIDSDLQPGHYSQLRLLLGDSSKIVVDGNDYELKVPSGSQSGVKLNLDFSIEPSEIVEFYLDFDASRSIKKHPNQDRYSLRPTFKVFKSVLSGTLAGTVMDSTGAGIEDVSVYAVTGNDTITTLTENSGEYKLILLEGTYTVYSLGDSILSDTTYSDLAINAGENLSGYNFIME